jgi:hypothetical protein
MAGSALITHGPGEPGAAPGSRASARRDLKSCLAPNAGQRVAGRAFDRFREGEHPWVQDHQRLEQQESPFWTPAHRREEVTIAPDALATATGAVYAIAWRQSVFAAAGQP